MVVLDYGHIINMHASASTLKSPDVIYHSDLRFITGAGYSTHHCTLYSLAGWTSLTQSRDFHIFIGKLPIYIWSLLASYLLSPLLRSSYNLD